MHAIDKRATVFKHAYVDAISRRRHHTFISGGNPLQIGNARGVLCIEHDPSSIFTDRDDARREALAHAANDAVTVEWARTLRIDAPANDAVRTRVRAAFAHDGVRVSFGPNTSFARSYVLVEGPQGSDPSELEQRVPDGRWYEEAIIVLAIEPTPADALQHVQNALGGRGGPAGVAGCEIAGSKLVVELLPSVTQPSLVLRIVDVELKRFNGHRRTQLLSALPMELVARIAADGLQAPEIAADRILEALLEAAHVE